ncbi:tetraacyldisaccharide 4'-kinase, partial [bacterium]|nr:tetraacyldisaccharide 4'-kinase [bacterium]
MRSIINIPAVLASLVYAVGFQLDLLLDGLRTKVRPRRPVVSVGNLVAGGSGKTPLVLWLAERLTERGFATGVVTRGYRGRWAKRTARPTLVSGGGDILMTAVEAGDEALLLARGLPRAKVAVGRIKALAAMLLDTPEVDVILVDDGLQHRRLARDYDLVALDRGDWLRYLEHGTRLLPWGRLREPYERLARVQAVVFWDSDEEEAHRLGLRFPSPLILRARTEPGGLTSEGNPLPPDALKGRPVVAFCGIAHPRSFFTDLVELGAELVETRAYPDHARYDERRMSELRRLLADHPGAVPVTTAKDAVKLPAGEPPGLTVLGQHVVFAG